MMNLEAKFLIVWMAVSCGGLSAAAQDFSYTTELNIPYYNGHIRNSDPYVEERCVLDVYYPKGKRDVATIVWFHGGGLTGGQKYIPEALKDQGMCIVAVNYRLYPRVKAPVYIEDAAAAVAWVFAHAERYGGSPSRIFISGHSAGGYLTSMLGLDKRWLAAHGIDANQIAGLIPLSGHTITHFTVRDERNIPRTQPVIDDLAPLYHVRADAPPLLLITGDQELEMMGRYEENAYLMRMMKVVGHPDTELYELSGYGHDIKGPAFPLLIQKVRRIVDLNLPSLRTQVSQERIMDLGTFSVSLSVKDMEASRQFYEKLGFHVFGGDPSSNWLIMKNRDCVIGLFQGLFERNTLTFNPGWNREAEALETYTDVRVLQGQLKAQGVDLVSEADENASGPASFMVVDPDGNPILVDQHV